MRGQKRKHRDGYPPVKYYGVVEEVVEADPQNGRTRSFILIDAVRADRFDEFGQAVLEDRSALALVRAMSTPKRWEDQFGLGNVSKGDWLAFTLDDSGSVPRAWELSAENNYGSGPSRSIRSMRRISGPPALTQPGDTALVMKLMATSSGALKQQRRVSANVAARRLGAGGKIEIIVLDVGQASAALIKRDGKPIGFFDIGAPIWFNKGSLPKPMFVPSISKGFVILSHWDFDHFDLGRRHKPYQGLDWYAPDQPVGPNTARFQADLGNALTFIDGAATNGGFSLARGTSAKANDRNGSGYQLRYEEGGQAVILTGDTGYEFIQPHMLLALGALSVPHHAGRSDANPPVSNPPGRAIASYGIPNSYRHPHGKTLSDHITQGWKIAPTAATPVYKRGHRRLFP
ncbi:hypothetical protein [Sphingomonas sp. AX6]|uniref:hypothetical protein n=1 Tax=Sphingomonas sp. AX6 TaxID=2653171 RepID=UPI0012F2B7E5|nr:hypothetical protein [Sphingomonas sp. AX6]VXC84735.1 Metal-dependent hydrolase, beta-lactamase superfamily II [Sphingomonas sp. AX6]